MSVRMTVKCVCSNLEVTSESVNIYQLSISYLLEGVGQSLVAVEIVVENIWKA